MPDRTEIGFVREWNSVDLGLDGIDTKTTGVKSGKLIYVGGYSEWMICVRQTSGANATSDGTNTAVGDIELDYYLYDGTKILSAKKIVTGLNLKVPFGTTDTMYVGCWANGGTGTAFVGTPVPGITGLRVLGTIRLSLNVTTANNSLPADATNPVTAQVFLRGWA